MRVPGTNSVIRFNVRSNVVVPLLAGSGTRIKILEAMAYGIPVITTSIGCEGLDVFDEEHVLIADTPESMAKCCVRVANDPRYAAFLTVNARTLVESKYEWRQAGDTLEAIYRRIAP